MGLMTALAVGTTIVGAGMSFKQAADAKRIQRQADQDSARYLADARKKAEKDEFAALNIPLDSYEAELENNLQATTTAIEALQEGDARALASGVAQVGRDAAQTAEDVRIAQGEQMFALDKMKAENRDEINQQLIQMDAAAAQDAAKRAASADMQVSAANTAGIQALGSALTQTLKARQLNPISQADKDLQAVLKAQGINISEYTANPAKFRNQVFDVSGNLLKVKNIDGVDRVQDNLVKLNQVPLKNITVPESNINLQTAINPNFLPSKNLGMTGSLMNPYNQPQRYSLFNNMGTDLNRFNYQDGIFGRPLTFQEILKQYN
tara:strand:+ start:733 stop:1698 length:966 start_codon:yes stop_codon:yes gene_type:complete